MRRTGLPVSLQLLAEVLIDRLRSRPTRTRNGAVAALVALGPAAAPAVSTALMQAHTAGLLKPLGAVAAAVGRGLPAAARDDLLMGLAIAFGRNPTPGGGASVLSAAEAIRGLPAAEELITPPTPETRRRRPRHRADGKHASLTTS